ncbi:MAG: hypothetical protein ABFR33_08685 [Verrucomicrobiota bacterium]
MNLSEWDTGRVVFVVVVSLLCGCATHRDGQAPAKISPTAGFAKNIGPPAEPVTSPYWDEPFKPTAAYGSYNSIFRKPDGTLEMWNNTMGEGPRDGLVRFRAKNPVAWKHPRTLAEHRLIDDVFEDDGATPAEKRRYTRPCVTFHPEDGYFAVAHVCDGYPAKHGSVYPAFLTSADGRRWVYHGRLKGEIEAFMPPGNSRWANGRGLFYQPEKPKTLNDAHPLENRFVFFSDQYPAKDCLALLYSADAKTWKFYRRNGEIVNLLPTGLQGRGMIFPQVIQAGRHGWFAWLSEAWPPKAIWRIHSPDGLNWSLFGDEQPEIVKPPDVMIKTLSAWYDDREDLLHSYLAIWEHVTPKLLNYRLYHATTTRFSLEL